MTDHEKMLRTLLEYIETGKLPPNYEEYRSGLLFALSDAHAALDGKPLYYYRELIER